jgi:hypothetical protein
MFTTRRHWHVVQSILSLRISTGRGYVAPSIHHPNTSHRSQTVVNIWAVSGYYVLLQIIVIIYSVSRHSTYFELKRSRRDFRCYYSGN